jgi:hypothetical protein
VSHCLPSVIRQPAPRCPGLGRQRQHLSVRWCCACQAAGTQAGEGSRR